MEMNGINIDIIGATSERKNVSFFSSSTEILAFPCCYCCLFWIIPFFSSSSFSFTHQVINVLWLCTSNLVCAFLFSSLLSFIHFFAPCYFFRFLSSFFPSAQLIDAVAPYNNWSNGQWFHYFNLICFVSFANCKMLIESRITYLLVAYDFFAYNLCECDWKPIDLWIYLYEFRVVHTVCATYTPQTLNI